MFIRNKKKYFNKIKNILCFKKFHLKYDPNMIFYINKKLNYNISNPRFMALFLNKNSNKITLSTKLSNMWEFIDGKIKSSNLFLAIKNKKLVLSKKEQTWNLYDNLLYNENKKQYVKLNYKYNIKLTENKNDATYFYCKNKEIAFIKSDFQIDFENNNILNNVTSKKINSLLNTEELNVKKNIGILLSAGTSSRFDSETPKQLYKLNDKEILLYSIESMEMLDLIIIVTNTINYDIIKYITKKINNIVIIYNDVNDRLVSLECGMKYLMEQFYANTINNIVIHDSARPFITKNHINVLLQSQMDNIYSHYGLSLVNGLVNLKNLYGPTIREDFFELCSPFSIKYKYFCFIMQNYMNIKSRITWEFLPIIKLFDKKYNLIQGNYNELRKITTIDDVKC
jgi:2-C-methyl-D-erythritol 4-phosphate cytidylyltransferase